MLCLCGSILLTLQLGQPVLVLPPPLVLVLQRPVIVLPIPQPPTMPQSVPPRAVPGPGDVTLRRA